ncbi:MAG: beta-hydroxyacyl-ACP dehydratase [Desulfobacteraceae bacterium]|nr:MAG: beta-hydroxyacyl-ACP dehydratase [Desulfobacteraceae bacterium]
MAGNTHILRQTLRLIPQQPPFRFIDTILHADEKTIQAEYRFRKDEVFYKGHFPGNPITPGVILIETMAQTAVVAMGIYQLLNQGVTGTELQQMITLFAFADAVEFNGIVVPGERVKISGGMIYLRRGHLKTKARIQRENGETVCSGVLTGTGVQKSKWS